MKKLGKLIVAVACVSAFAGCGVEADYEPESEEISSVTQALEFSVDGKWTGTAFANDSFDFNNDGVAARTAVFRATNQLRFASIEGVGDTVLVAIDGSGSCPPGVLELKAIGTFTFKGHLPENALYAEFDPNAPNVCFDPANPNEPLQVVVTGGTGIYAGATGTGTMIFHDTVRIAKTVTLPGFPPLPAPLMVDSWGEFSLSVQTP